MATTNLGRVAIIHQGAYAAGTTYEMLDCVSLNGSSYVFINATPTAGKDPETETGYWAMMAEKGQTIAPQGVYDAATEYSYLDAITHQGSSYLYINATPSTGSTPPNVTYWQLMAQSGMPAAPSTWAEFRDAVRNGTIDEFFAVGDQFNVLKGATNLVFDLVDIGSSARNVVANGNAPLDTTYFTNFPNAKPVTLLMRDTISGVVFDGPEANYNITTEIANGAKCNISLENATIAGATYNFTAPSAMVVGGRLRIIDATHVGYYVTPYTGAPTSILMAAGAADETFLSIAASLSAQNHKDRVSDGSNKYSESAIRQWLTAAGAAGTFWASKSIYDLAPGWNATLSGFLYGLDPSFVSAVGLTTRQTEKNTITDGGGDENGTDKFFLPSRKEIFGEMENLTNKGAQLQRYAGATDADRIKFDAAALTVCYWWLRSPSAGTSSSARYVRSSGAFGYNIAVYGFSAAAACVIL